VISESERIILFQSLSGSRAYGLHTENSDIDTICVTAFPLRRYFAHNIREYTKQSQQVNGEYDTTTVDVAQFVQNCATGNVQLLETLWSECLFTTPAGHLLRKNRDMFSTKLTLHAYVGFAKAQRKKANTVFDWKKSARTAMRLCLQGAQFSFTGQVCVGLTPNAKRLVLGAKPDEALDRAIDALEEALNHCELPDEPDWDATHNLVLEILELAENGVE
jgi:RNA repair pathway DNA polymerase beta family